MNKSRSFDRAADIYDQTRVSLAPIVTQGVQAILDIVGAEARILDVGTGTGRISVPLLERGARLTGCDLSAKMLLKLLEKFPAAQLTQSDAAHLPFPTYYFDAVMTVHVMHLVAPWREALQEFKRVLKPGGAYLNIATHEAVGFSIRDAIRDVWRKELAGRELDGRHPGADDYRDLLNEIKRMGASLTEVEAVRFKIIYTLREELERFASRVYSNTWDIPDDIFNASLDALRLLVERDYGNLERQIEDEVHMIITVARFQA